MSLWDYIAIPFGWLLLTLYNLVGNYGVAIFLFALVVKLILLPFQMKSKKSMMRMSALQPQIAELQKRHEGNPRKLQEETRLFENYYFQNKKKNADRHWEAIERTREAIKGLDSLRSALAGRMDEIAYYDYVFSGRAETADAATEFKDTYVCMTPELEIIAMTTERRDLHKAGGRAIPGYRQMLGDTPEEE